MAYGSVILVPGLNTERTPTLNQAGFSATSLIRFKDQLVQKYGGWARYYAFPVTGTIRDLHGWSDFRQSGVSHVAIGSTNALQLLTNNADGSQAVSNITPQTKTTDFAPNFTTTISTPTVQITDSNITNVTTFDSVYFNTPISIGGLILSGLYPIASITGASSYTITAASNATSSVSNGGAVPVFTTTSGSSSVSVNLTANGRAVGDIVTFPIATTGNGVTISGSYTVVTITDPDNFTINATAQATASSSFSMNSALAELVYYIALGPTAAAQGYGLGNYGAGLYGFGTSGGSSQTGTPITATDWTDDNWGTLMLSCPENGGLYVYDPTGGFINAQLVATAPPFNAGMFVSTSQQQVFLWGSTTTNDIGVSQDAMLVAWSDVGDYTVWDALTTNQAGNFRIPIGSKIVAGIAAQNQNIFITDLDVWAANYQGPPLVWGFNKIGAGAGAISSHSVQQLRGGLYWMGQKNFYQYTGQGVSVIPCPVWDAVFQNLNTSNTHNIRAMPNTPFNEVGWLFPSAASSGECDTYVKFNITEQGGPWDVGPMDRTAWIDQSALGMPIGASSGGVLYQHETTNDAAGAPINASFTTGYFFIAEGEDYVLVTEILPDMIWGTYSGAQTASFLLTFNVIDYMGDTPRTFGPYTVTRSTQFITTRMRGRQMSIMGQSLDSGSFWRLGRVRYRYQPDGRR